MVCQDLISSNLQFIQADLCYIYSVGKEIKYILQLVAFYFINFRIGAPGACDGGEMFILNVKYLCPEATSGPELIFYIFAIITFFFLPFK